MEITRDEWIVLHRKLVGEMLTTADVATITVVADKIRLMAANDLSRADIADARTRRTK